MQNLQTRVEHSLTPIVKRWAAQDRKLLLPLFQNIASGEPLDEADMAKIMERRNNQCCSILNTNLVEIDLCGRVSELFGVTREPTLHRIEVGGTTLHSCCALVAHMVPAIMQHDVIVESTDPISGDTVRFEISANTELRHVEPRTVCASMIDCTFEKVVASPKAGFCSHVKHFGSAESATEFISMNAGRYQMSIEDFHDAAKWLYHRIWQ